MLLAIDTATRCASLALHTGTGVLVEVTWQAADHHTGVLMPQVTWLLKQAGAEVRQLTALAVAIGPGSFTGLRVGLAVAKGLALANGLPLVGVPTLDVLAHAQAVHSGRLVAVLQAGRGKLAGQVYQRRRSAWRAHGEVTVTTAEHIGEDWETPTWLCGELTPEQRTAIGARLGGRVRLIDPAHSLRRAGFLAELGWRRLNAGDPDDLDTLRPIYLSTTGVSAL